MKITLQWKSIKNYGISFLELDFSKEYGYVDFVVCNVVLCITWGKVHKEG